MAGGGGMAGSVDYPLYMRTMHGLWLTECNLILQAALAGASPYAGAFAYNPETDLELVQTDIDAYSRLVDDFSPTDWDDLLAQANTGIDDVILTDADITAEVEAQELVNVAALQRAIGRMNAGRADMSSSLTSAFVFGVADMEAEALRPLDLLGAQLRRDRAGQRQGLVLQATGQLVGMLTDKMSMAKERTQLQLELARLTISSQSARLDQELAIDAQDATWDLNLFSYAGNLMASISGGIASAEHTPRHQQMMSNALGTISALGPLVAAL